MKGDNIMELVADNDVKKLGREGKYEVKFDENVLPFINPYLRSEEGKVSIIEDVIRTMLDVDKDVKLDSIYRRLRSILKDSDIGVSLGAEHRNTPYEYKVITFWSKARYGGTFYQA